MWAIVIALGCLPGLEGALPPWGLAFILSEGVLGVAWGGEQ